MLLHQKIARVIADKGFTGLWSTLGSAVQKNRTSSAPDPSCDRVSQQHVRDYEQNLRDFHQKARGLGHDDIEKYYWYHTIDLGNGLVTPGDFDYRASLAAYHFPVSMKGMNVLDVGSATGFFAFEFERRGARVVSVELPAITDWDMPTGEDRDRTLKGLMEQHRVNTVDAVYHYHLDGPFQLCHKLLQSQVQRVYSTVYELTTQKLGAEPFDLIFLGDVLLHTFAPLKVLAVLAPFCRGTFVITEHLADEDDHARPSMVYAGGATPTLDWRTWWYPNKVCLEQMLKRLGFATVQIVGHPNALYRPKGRPHRTTVLHAQKSRMTLEQLH